ncbi:MAG: bifunctional non-ous end joining protein LigD [Acidimicrobiaceae bacterium]|nr:bifunctional non-ous end joining protein LigD [Acidimicrobiaceae bacterium]
MTPASAKSEVVVEGRALTLSNLDKPLYPDGFTKGQVLDYYARIAPVLVPQLSGRPISLHRFPNGVDGQSFWEKNCPSHRPEWMATAPVFLSERRRTVQFCLIEDLPSLMWVVNLAAIELHPSLARADDLERPTSIVFDLDPGPPANVIDCCRVAVWLRDLLGQLHLESVVKTSGSKGLQLYVPLNSPVDYTSGSQPFSLALAQLLERHHPDKVVSLQRKDLRPGKVLIDWSQNTRTKTTVSVYSLRARPRPTVSTPITWDEVEDALGDEDPEVLVFETDDTLARVAAHGDLFAPLLTLEQELPLLSA